MWKRRVIISSVLIVFSIVTVLLLSYVTISRLAFVGDSILYGKRISEFVRELRKELVKQKDLQRVTIKASDGMQLQAFLIKREKARANILLCHGYRSTKEFMYGFISIFPDCNLLLFDFRAHGESDGGVISIGYHEYKDVIAAGNYLRQVDPSLPLVILGISMGGAATLKAVYNQQNLAEALIIDSTFSDLKTMMLQSYSLKVGLPYYPFFPVIKGMFDYFANCDADNMNSMEYVKGIPLPIFFIHSCNDSFIRPEHSLRLYSLATNPRTKLWIGPRCRHAWLNTYQAALYKVKVNRFLKQAIDLDLTDSIDNKQIQAV